MLRLDSKDILFLAFYWQTLERVSDRHSAAELLAVVGFNNQLKNFCLTYQEIANIPLGDESIRCGQNLEVNGEKATGQVEEFPKINQLLMTEPQPKYSATEKQALFTL
ncbi:Uncharacterized protein Rs2_33864 [Raphanus sativus]|nr:Uncharacterized protein Rs2_33864 [Raphanus sativus]